MTNPNLDTCLDVLADQRRRRVVRELRQEENAESSVETLVDRLCASEPTSEVDSPSDRDQLAVHLHHIDLPKLADRDVVEYDSSSGTVRYRPNDRIEAILDSLPEEPIPARP